MTDFLTDLLALCFHEQGIANPQELAVKAAATIRRAKLTHERNITLATIQADPCRDYKVVKHRYHVTVNTVYKAWKFKIP